MDLVYVQAMTWECTGWKSTQEAIVTTASAAENSSAVTSSNSRLVLACRNLW